MKECDKRKSHTSSKLHMIYISSIDGRDPATKTFTNPCITTQRVCSAGVWYLTAVT